MSNRLLRRPVGLSSKITVFTLSVTLLANTVFAAPEASRTAIVSIGEFGQDIRFGVGSVNFGATVNGWANNLALFLSGKRAAPQLGRIEIVPGNITIRQGEPTNFTAFGYTASGGRVSGLRFDWTVEDTGRGQGTRNLPDGIFRAPRPE